MTLKDLEMLDTNTLTVKTVAEFLGKDPQVIRDQAEREPKYLGFPICKAGHSYCIPRLGFIAWVKGMTPIMVMDQRVHMSKILY
jgi:hypothetical protein